MAQSLWRSSQEPAPVQLQRGSYEHCGVTFNDERYSLTQPDTNAYLLFDRKYHQSTFISEAFMNFLRLFLGGRVAFAANVQLPQSSPGLIHKLLSNGARHVTD